MRKLMLPFVSAAEGRSATATVPAPGLLDDAERSFAMSYIWRLYPHCQYSYDQSVFSLFGQVTAADTAAAQYLSETSKTAAAGCG
jgi:hypothetical protein